MINFFTDKKKYVVIILKKMRQDVLFMRPVGELRAWELYTGQSIWFFFVGILFFLIKFLLDKTLLQRSETFQWGFDLIAKIGSGQALPTDGARFAKSILE